MACFILHPHDWEIKIPTTSSIQKVTFYEIKVRIGQISWIVKHRYKNFVDLHDTLNSDHSISKDILPPKKVLGNRDPDFIEKRRRDLEVYLNYVVKLLQKTMPKKLVLFLHLEQYDIMFLLQDMSEGIVDNSSLTPKYNNNFSILQVHGISERMKMPCPPIEMFGPKYDFSIVLEFCRQLETVTVSGDSNIYTNSNIDPKKLPFELSCFKSMSKLLLYNIMVQNLCNASNLRLSLKSLSALECSIKNVSEVLLCDELHKNWSSTTKEKIWNLSDVDFSQNEIERIDGSIALAPCLISMNLNSNRILEISNLSSLENLQNLYLSGNRIVNLNNLSLQLKSVKFIDLSQNQISVLQGLEELSTLQGVNLSSNCIKDINQVTYVSCLPNLDYIVLTGNPLATIVDYRVKVLEAFGNRYSKVCLDNEQSTQKELDTVAVLQALRFVKEGKAPNFQQSPTQYSKG